MRSDLNVETRVRIGNDPPHHPTLSMVTPIDNEPCCGQVACHAHPAPQRVLAVLGVSPKLDPALKEERSARNQIALSIAAFSAVMALFVLVFVRKFVVVPI